MKRYAEHADKVLADLIREGDADAFTEIYQRHRGVLYVHALRMLRSEDEAKDVVQDLFAVLWSRRTEIEMTGTVSGYLYTAVKNRILDQIARAQTRDKYINSLAGFISEGEFVTDNQVREKELSTLIEREVELLPEKMKQIFKLSREENLSHKDIALELKLSDKTVKKQVSNAIMILKKRLDVAFLLIISAIS
jgi:RNA polymerase sigma-70 factor (ECF subfamily)